MGSIHPPRRWHMYVPIAASSGGEAIGLLPVLVLVTILFLSVGLHQVGMVRAADEAPSSTLTGTFTGSSTSSTHDEFENSNSASLPESFFPPGYAFIPYVDSAPEEDTTIDPDDNLFYSEQAPGDHLHHSLVYHFALEVFTDIRVSPYTLTRTIVGAEEREALFEAQRQEAQEEEKERSKETKVHASRNSVDVVQRHKCDVFTTAFFAPDELLSTLVMGDYPGDDHCLSPFSQLMDRYLAYQGDIVPIPNHICDDFVALMHLPNRRPLVVTSFNWMAGRFAYRCVFLRSHSLRTAKRKFVLLTSEGDNAAVNSFFLYDVMQEKKFNISVFLNHPLLAHWYGNNGGIDHPKFTPIPLGNKVLTLEAFSSLQPFSFGWSQAAAQKNKLTHKYLVGLNLSALFPHLQHPLTLARKGSSFIEYALEIFAGGTVDPPIQWIPLDKLPQRITTIYIVHLPMERYKRTDRPSLINDVLIFNATSSSRAAKAAQHIALLPFSVAMYHRLQQNLPGSPSRELKMLTGFAVWDWRKELNEFLKRPEMEPLVYRVLTSEPGEFYSMMPLYNFVISPIGFGYDCFRTWEALAFGAIPIIQHPTMVKGSLECVGGPSALSYGHEVDIERFLDVYQDLPVVVITNITQLTRDNLEKWRAAIYEKAQRREYKYEKLFAQYWIDKIYGHTNED